MYEVTAPLIHSMQLIWKFVASEEDYVSQLQLLAEEYLPQCDIASGSRKPPLSKEQVTDIFRNW